MTPLVNIGHTLKDLGRLREILLVLAKHGFGFFIDQVNLSAYVPGFRLRRRRPPKLSAPARVRLALEELGPVFIKFGQALSVRPDIVPHEYIVELSKLQDGVPPFSPAEASRVLQEELGAPPEKHFKHFDPRPVAAASIAQVHRATTHAGKEVVLKIQRPGLRKIMEADIEILRFLARLWESVYKQDLPRRPVEFVDEFDRLMQEELDFLIEGRHMDRLRKNFAGRVSYRFPKIDWESSTARCLTQEYIQGKKITELPKNASLAQKKRLAQILVDAYILMVLEDHFFHADPHPGNLLVDAKGHLAFLDAGQVGRLDSDTVEAFTDMMLALVRQDTDGVVEAYLSLGTAEESVDMRALKRDVSIFLEQYYALPVEKLSFGKSLQDLITISLKHRIQLPADFVVLAKTFLGAEGLARRLNPELNLIDAARPIAERILRRRYQPKHLWGEFRSHVGGLRRFVLGLPMQLRDLLAKLQRGHLKIEFEHKGLEDFQHSLDRASNRFSFAVIVAALIIGSSLLLFSHVGLRWGDFSILGLVGYLLAGLLGIWLIIAIIRSGRL